MPILNIRKRLPVLEVIPKDATQEERNAIFQRNREKSLAQAKENISNMLDAVLENHPEETLEILALCCFVEPQDVDNYPMNAYLEAFNSLINDKAVLSFFTSLASLAQMNTSTASKA